MPDGFNPDNLGSQENSNKNEPQKDATTKVLEALGGQDRAFIEFLDNYPDERAFDDPRFLEISDKTDHEYVVLGSILGLTGEEWRLLPEALKIEKGPIVKKVREFARQYRAMSAFRSGELIFGTATSLEEYAKNKSYGEIEKKILEGKTTDDYDQDEIEGFLYSFKDDYIDKQVTDILGRHKNLKNKSEVLKNKIKEKTIAAIEDWEEEKDHRLDKINNANKRLDKAHDLLIDRLNELTHARHFARKYVQDLNSQLPGEIAKAAPSGRVTLNKGFIRKKTVDAKSKGVEKRESRTYKVNLVDDLKSSLNSELHRTVKTPKGRKTGLNQIFEKTIRNEVQGNSDLLERQRKYLLDVEFFSPNTRRDNARKLISIYESLSNDDLIRAYKGSDEYFQERLLSKIETITGFSSLEEDRGRYLSLEWTIRNELKSKGKDGKGLSGFQKFTKAKKMFEHLQDYLEHSSGPTEDIGKVKDKLENAINTPIITANADGTFALNPDIFKTESKEVIEGGAKVTKTNQKIISDPETLLKNFSMTKHFGFMTKDTHEADFAKKRSEFLVKYIKQEEKDWWKEKSENLKIRESFLKGRKKFAGDYASTLKMLANKSLLDYEENPTECSLDVAYAAGNILDGSGNVIDEYKAIVDWHLREENHNEETVKYLDVNLKILEKKKNYIEENKFDEDISKIKDFSEELLSSPFIDSVGEINPVFVELETIVKKEAGGASEKSFAVARATSDDYLELYFAKAGAEARISDDDIVGKEMQKARKAFLRDKIEKNPEATGLEHLKSKISQEAAFVNNANALAKDLKKNLEGIASKPLSEFEAQKDFLDDFILDGYRPAFTLEDEMNENRIAFIEHKDTPLEPGVREGIESARKRIQEKRGFIEKDTATSTLESTKTDLEAKMKLPLLQITGGKEKFNELYWTSDAQEVTDRAAGASKTIAQVDVINKWNDRDILKRLAFADYEKVDEEEKKMMDDKIAYLSQKMKGDAFKEDFSKFEAEYKRNVKFLEGRISYAKKYIEEMKTLASKSVAELEEMEGEGELKFSVDEPVTKSLNVAAGISPDSDDPYKTDKGREAVIQWTIDNSDIKPKKIEKFKENSKIFKSKTMFFKVERTKKTHEKFYTHYKIISEAPLSLPSGDPDPLYISKEEKTGGKGSVDTKLVYKYPYNAKELSGLLIDPDFDESIKTHGKKSVEAIMLQAKREYITEKVTNDPAKDAERKSIEKRLTSNKNFVENVLGSSRSYVSSIESASRKSFKDLMEAYQKNEDHPRKAAEIAAGCYIKKKDLAPNFARCRLLMWAVKQDDNLEERRKDATKILDNKMNIVEHNDDVRKKIVEKSKDIYTAYLQIIQEGQMRTSPAALENARGMSPGLKALPEQYFDLPLHLTEKVSGGSLAYLGVVAQGHIDALGSGKKSPYGDFIKGYYDEMYNLGDADYNKEYEDLENVQSIDTKGRIKNAQRLRVTMETSIGGNLSDYASITSEKAKEIYKDLFLEKKGDTWPNTVQGKMLALMYDKDLVDAFNNLYASINVEDLESLTEEVDKERREKAVDDLFKEGKEHFISQEKAKESLKDVEALFGNARQFSIDLGKEYFKVPRAIDRKPVIDHLDKIYKDFKPQKRQDLIDFDENIRNKVVHADGITPYTKAEKVNDLRDMLDTRFDGFPMDQQKRFMRRIGKERLGYLLRPGVKFNDTTYLDFVNTGNLQAQLHIAISLFEGKSHNDEVLSEVVNMLEEFDRHLMRSQAIEDLRDKGVIMEEFEDQYLNEDTGGTLDELGGSTLELDWVSNIVSSRATSLQYFLTEKMKELPSHFEVSTNRKTGNYRSRLGEGGYSLVEAVDQWLHKEEILPDSLHILGTDNLALIDSDRAENIEKLVSKMITLNPELRALYTMWHTAPQSEKGQVHQWFGSEIQTIWDNDKLAAIDAGLGVFTVPSASVFGHPCATPTLDIFEMSKASYETNHPFFNPKDQQLSPYPAGHQLAFYKNLEKNWKVMMWSYAQERFRDEDQVLLNNKGYYVGVDRDFNDELDLTYGKDGESNHIDSLLKTPGSASFRRPESVVDYGEKIRKARVEGVLFEKIIEHINKDKQKELLKERGTDSFGEIKTLERQKEKLRYGIESIMKTLSSGNLVSIDDDMKVSIDWTQSAVDMSKGLISDQWKLFGLDKSDVKEKILEELNKTSERHSKEVDRHLKGNLRHAAYTYRRQVEQAIDFEKGMNKKTTRLSRFFSKQLHTDDRYDLDKRENPGDYIIMKTQQIS